LIDQAASDPQSGSEWTADFEVSNDRFDAFPLTLRNTVNGAERTVTVIGVWSSRLTQDITAGVYVNAESYASVYGEPELNRTYVTLASGRDAEIAAQQIESVLASRGVQADSVSALIDEETAQERAFDRMFMGLMVLGLLVGVAALGVIAFRSVVERRQQIGMLRAIGYQRESIALTFVMESGFVGMMGILSGVIGGVIVSRNIFTTGLFANQGVEFTMPWGEVLLMAAAALIVSLAMTWLPSRNAAAVPVADALRYE
jgi:putative ABC transport system permease protein